MSDEQIDVTRIYPEVDTTKRSPTLGRVNGFGLGLYGRRDSDPQTGLYVKTQCFSALFLPVLAMRSYVVADGGGGWYVLGRVPLSAFAKLWNVALLVIVLAGVSLIGLAAYSASPGQKVARQMAQAQTLIDNGDQAGAAAKYREVATGKSDRAGEGDAALAQLVTDTLDQGPMDQAVGVMQVAVGYARNRGGALSGMDLVQAAMDAAQTDTQAAAGDRLALLDAVEPMLNETRREAWNNARLDMLEAQVNADPNDIDARVELARVYESRNEMGRVRELLLPSIDQLGQTEGARMLGQILAAEGDYERAYPLLQPYIKANLYELELAEQTLDNYYDSIYDSAIAELQNGEASDGWYTAYDRAGETQQNEMVDRYFEQKLEQDANYATALERYYELQGIVPAALDLGIVQLDRARAMTDPAARKAELEAAEQTFLSIQSAAGGSASYQLYLGQVYYWLGKADEGAALFDQLIAGSNNDVDIQLEVARTLRFVGETERARDMYEQAYAASTDTQYKRFIARSLAAMADTLEDQVLWLERSDTSADDVRASLAHTQGQLAQDDGDEATASEYYLEATRIYDAMPENSSTLNNSALVWFSRFDISRDVQDLNNAVDRLAKATELDPDNSILLYNAGSAMLALAYHRQLQDELDLSALDVGGSSDLLAYLYRDQAGRDARRARAVADPMFARAQSMLQRASVLAPKRVGGYFYLASIHNVSRDEAALRRLLETARSAQPDTTASRDAYDETRAGDNDATRLTQLGEQTAKLEALIARDDAAPATAAAARVLLIGALMELDGLGQAIDADRMVRLAEEADTLHPSSISDNTLEYALIFRASRRLAADHPVITDLRTRLTRDYDFYDRFILAMEKDPALRDAAAQDPDIRRVIDIISGQHERFPDVGSVRSWAMLQQVAPSNAPAAAQVVQADVMGQLQRELNHFLSPYSGSYVLAQARRHTLDGDPSAAQQLLEDYAALGYPLP